MVPALFKQYTGIAFPNNLDEADAALNQISSSSLSIKSIVDLCNTIESCKAASGSLAAKLHTYLGYGEETPLALPINRQQFRKLALKVVARFLTNQCESNKFCKTELEKLPIGTGQDTAIELLLKKLTGNDSGLPTTKREAMNFMIRLGKLAFKRFSGVDFPRNEKEAIEAFKKIVMTVGVDKGLKPLCDAIDACRDAPGATVTEKVLGYAGADDMVTLPTDAKGVKKLGLKMVLRFMTDLCNKSKVCKKALEGKSVESFLSELLGRPVTVPESKAEAKQMLVTVGKAAFKKYSGVNFPTNKKEAIQAFKKIATSQLFAVVLEHVCNAIPACASMNDAPGDSVISKSLKYIGGNGAAPSMPTSAEEMKKLALKILFVFLQQLCEASTHTFYMTLQM
jgi:hypothetical protein